MSEEIKNEPIPVEELKQLTPVVDDEGTIKLDMRQLNGEANADTIEETTDVVADQQAEPVQEVEAEVSQQREPVQDEAPAEEPVEFLQEITDEEVEEVADELADEINEAVAEQNYSGKELPENIQKVVDFMDETGGSLEDYVKLNTDYASLNEDQLLREYYETKYSAYDREDIDFLLSDKFSYDEDIDDEREIRLKKLERKQALSEAKNHLNGLKSKYYSEIKAGSRLTTDQNKAVEFFNRYTKESEEAAKVTERQTSRFKSASDKVFSDSFQGFDYNVGDKKYRYKVKNAGEVKETQGDINNFIKKFLNEKNEMSDAKGYHKSLFTAMNADSVAQHFYEQGKADAMKDSMSRTKNVNMNARGVHEKVTTSNGMSIRSVDSGDSSSKLRIKSRRK
jgi:hypothetical protein